MPGKTNLVTRQIQDVTVATINDTALLDGASIKRMGESLYALVDHQAVKKLVIDFSSVKFLASGALGMLLTLRKKSVEIRGAVTLCGLRPELHKIFQMTNLDRLFGFFDTEEEALNSFGVSTEA